MPEEGAPGLSILPRCGCRQESRGEAFRQSSIEGWSWAVLNPAGEEQPPGSLPARNSSGSSGWQRGADSWVRARPRRWPGQPCVMSVELCGLLPFPEFAFYAVEFIF